MHPAEKQLMLEKCLSRSHKCLVKADYYERLGKPDLANEWEKESKRELKRYEFIDHNRQVALNVDWLGLL